MSERPVECSQCKKEVQTLYKEIVGKTTTVTEMCANCPILQQRLYGGSGKLDKPENAQTGVYCGRCHTPLELIKMGNPMGCAQCYNVFEDFLVQELITEDRLPKSLHTARRNQPLHIGKTPDKSASLPLSNRLAELNEALNQALKKEDYEEAALLRDQIKQLMEKDGRL